MNLRSYVILGLLVVTLAATGCPIPKSGPPESPEGVLIQYKYPEGRVLHYRMESKTRMRFTMPFITDIQQVRTETVVDIIEEVLQEPIGGYAIIEQRVKNIQFVMYRRNRLLFDSRRPGDFGPQPQFENLLNLPGMTVRYEVNTLGGIRRAEGLAEMVDVMGSDTMSRVFQNAQPVLPDYPVSPGQSWESRSEIPLGPGRGFQGTMELVDNTGLVEVREVEGARQAIIELERQVSIRMDSVADRNNRRKKPAVKGNGETLSTVIFDIERGIILSANGRIRVSMSAEVSDQPLLENLVLEIEGIFKNTLIE